MILSEREELLEMEQISLTLDYDVEDEFPFDDVDEPCEIEAINVSIEDEIPVIYMMVEDEVPNMNTLKLSL